MLIAEKVYSVRAAWKLLSPNPSAGREINLFVDFFIGGAKTPKFPRD